MNGAESKHQNGARIVTDDGCAVADLLTLQGLWTEAQYFKLTNSCNHLVEFTDGQLEILPMPTDRHQSILKFLFRALLFVEDVGGVVHFAALRLRIRSGKFREPDLLLLLDASDPRRGDDYWRGADLVMEVVSPDNPARDLVEKRADYAEAEIPEYWIVNPIDETVTVLGLSDGQYVEHLVFRRGQQARSLCLPEFSVAVTAVFDAGGEGRE